MRALRTIALIAGRDISDLLHERSLLTMTLAPVALLVLFVALTSVFEIGKAEYRVAVGAPVSAQVARAAQSYAVLNDRSIVIAARADDAAVRRAVRGGFADAGLVRGGTEIVADGRLDRRLLTSLQRGSHAVRAGVQPPRPATVSQRADGLVAQYWAPFFVLLVVYLLLQTWGRAVAANVLAERSSRLIEVLLATVRARELLVGKVAGTGVVAALQLLVVVLAGTAVARVAGAGLSDVVIGRAIAVAVVWFALGYVLYGAMYAVAGVMTGTHRELHSAAAPLTAIIGLSFVLSVVALADSDGPLAGILSIVPLTAPMNAPSRVVAGDMPVGQLALSFGLLLASAAAALAAALRVYAGGALGVDPRPRLRDAWTRGAS